LLNPNEKRKTQETNVDVISDNTVCGRFPHGNSTWDYLQACATNPRCKSNSWQMVIFYNTNWLSLI